MMFTVGSLFSGIGAFDYGAQLAGAAIAWQCETDPFCRAALAKHWPGVPTYRDVRMLGEPAMCPDGSTTMEDRPSDVDIIIGGFPCQDISSAGRGAGIGGSRSRLWFEMLRVIRLLRPRWVVAENVLALRTRGADVVLAGLEQEGYTCWPTVVGADDVGAPHKRKRVWIVAYRDCGGRNEGQRGLSEGEPEPARRGLADTDSERRDGKALHPRSRGHDEAAPLHHWPSPPGQPQYSWEEPRLVANAEGVGRSREGERRDSQERVPERGGEGGAHASEQGERRRGARAARRLGRKGDAQGDGAGAPDGTTEPPMGAATDGLAERLARRRAARWRRDALKAIGNAGVPQIVTLIVRAIASVETAR